MAQARPRVQVRERRVALLAVGPAVRAVGGVEQRLVRDAAAHIVGVAPLAVVHAELRGGVRVLQQAIEQVDLLVLFAAQAMAERMRQGERAQRSDGVDKQRVRAVERIDEAAGGQGRPPPRLDGAADLERQLIEVHLPRVRFDAAFARQPPQGAVGADVVEPVIVHADVREVRRHPVERALPGPARGMRDRRSRRTAAAPRRRRSLRSIRSSRGRCIVPATVKTGAPLDDHERSSDRIFAADSSNIPSIAGSRSRGVRERSLRIMSGQILSRSVIAADAALTGSATCPGLRRPRS